MAEPSPRARGLLRSLHKSQNKARPSDTPSNVLNPPGLHGDMEAIKEGTWPKGGDGKGFGCTCCPGGLLWPPVKCPVLLISALLTGRGGLPVLCAAKLGVGLCSWCPVRSPLHPPALCLSLPQSSLSTCVCLRRQQGPLRLLQEMRGSRACTPGSTTLGPPTHPSPALSLLPSLWVSLRGSPALGHFHCQAAVSSPSSLPWAGRSAFSLAFLSAGNLASTDADFCLRSESMVVMLPTLREALEFGKPFLSFNKARLLRPLFCQGGKAK